MREGSAHPNEIHKHKRPSRPLSSLPQPPLQENPRDTGVTGSEGGGEVGKGNSSGRGCPRGHGGGGVAAAQGHRPEVDAAPSTVTRELLPNSSSRRQHPARAHCPRSRASPTLVLTVTRAWSQLGHVVKTKHLRRAEARWTASVAYLTEKGRVSAREVSDEGLAPSAPPSLSPHRYLPH